MTESTPPGAYEPQHDVAPSASAPVAARRRTGRVLLIAGVAIAAVAGVGGYSFGVQHERHRIATAVTAAFTGALGSLTASPTSSAPAAPAAATGGGYVPTAGEIELPVKVLSKECFGSAGCNLNVRITFAAEDVSKLTGSDFEVTYQLNGGNDGGQVGTFEVRNGRYDAPTELVQTASTSDEVTASVTDVQPAG